MRHYIIPVFIPHLGCPHTCVFCNQSRISGCQAADPQSLGAADVQAIAARHLATLPPGEKTVELSFFGGSFTGIPVHQQLELLGAARDLRQAGAISHIRCSTRPDFIDDEVLERCASFGMDIIELGVQSLDDPVLVQSGRGHTAEDVEQASRLIRSRGITLGHQIMPGLPGADSASDLATARASIAMKPDQVRIYPTLVVRGTPLAELYAAGRYLPLELEDAVARCAELLTLYEAAGIQVLRVGLQANQELTEGADLIAGPHHPAFRELVLSRRLHERIAGSLSDAPGSWELLLHPKDQSVLYAAGRRYYRRNQARISRVKATDQIRRGQVILRREGTLDISLCI
ncbi:MAG: radical SAM protein [Clostridiaceae bacterium]